MSLDAPKVASHDGKLWVSFEDYTKMFHHWVGDWANTAGRMGRVLDWANDEQKKILCDLAGV